MTTARRHLICLESTPYYHCTSRCVRRAFLCGSDRYSGKSYEHRRDWVESLLLTLSKAFCIDIAAYAVMSNHYHVILKVNTELASALTDSELIDRWSLIYKPSEMVCRYRSGAEVSDAEQLIIAAMLERWRDTLINISRFMGYMNERIARRANKEDGCKGRFWEGRFHSQALLDDTALLQCMAYVDLNPIRAGLANTPEDSKYTSVKRRIDKLAHPEKNDNLLPFMTFESHTIALEKADCQWETKIPMKFCDYLDLLNWTGRALKSIDRQEILGEAPPILGQMGFLSGEWVSLVEPKNNWRRKALGSVEKVRMYCESIGQKWLCQTHKNTVSHMHT